METQGGKDGEFDRIIEFAIRTDVELYTAMPTGWRKITGSMTAARGSTWFTMENHIFQAKENSAFGRKRMFEIGF